MNRLTIQTVALALSCSMIFGGCDSVEGARIARGFIPTLTVTGPWGRRTIQAPEETFMSPRLKFQTYVVKGNVAGASRVLRREWLNVPIKGQPPLYYAAVNGSTPMVQLLARNGANAGYRSGGRSLAYWAASYGQFGTASTLVSLGGGTDGDLDRGRTVYNHNMAVQRQQLLALSAAALLFLEAASHSSPSGGGRDQFGNTEHDYTVMGLQHQATRDNLSSVYNTNRR